jgi:hypothetical protein
MKMKARSQKPEARSRKSNGTQLFTHHAPRITVRSLWLSLTLLASFCLRANAQQYSIDWFTIDGGGGTSTNGQYSLSGTIGQPDAGAAMTNGNYSLTGGFWAIDGVAVVQTPGSPILSVVVPMPNTVVVSWPSPSTGFTLQTNNNLATTNWGNFLGTIIDTGITKNVTNKPPVGNLFFRLKNP